MAGIELDERSAGRRGGLLIRVVVLRLARLRRRDADACSVPLERRQRRHSQHHVLSSGPRGARCDSSRRTNRRSPWRPAASAMQHSCLGWRCARVHHIDHQDSESLLRCQGSRGYHQSPIATVRCCYATIDTVTAKPRHRTVFRRGHRQLRCTARLCAGCSPSKSDRIR